MEAAEDCGGSNCLGVKGGWMLMGWRKDESWSGGGLVEEVDVLILMSDFHSLGR